MPSVPAKQYMFACMPCKAHGENCSSAGRLLKLVHPGSLTKTVQGLSCKPVHAARLGNNKKLIHQQCRVMLVLDYALCENQQRCHLNVGSTSVTILALT